jgi:hypothetical protein
LCRFSGKRHDISNKPPGVKGAEADAPEVALRRAALGTLLPEFGQMEFNRNQYFFLGVVVLLMGLQLRAVSSYVLTAEATRFLAERTQSGAESTLFALTKDFGAGPQKVIQPPEWVGWCLISVGAVLILHSLAMKRPGA